MSCDDVVIDPDPAKDSKGNIMYYTYRLVKPLNEKIVSKLKNNKKNNTTRKPRPTARITVSTFHMPAAKELNETLSKAFNFKDQPQEFKDMFDKKGVLKKENRSKFAFIEWLDRINLNYTSPTNGKEVGTFIKNTNVKNYFDIDPSKINTNETLSKYHIKNDKHISLVKGSATKLMECFMGPNSPLYKMGIEYVVLHANSRDLEKNYYGRKFGFTTLEGIPDQNATFYLLDSDDFNQPNYKQAEIAKEKYQKKPVVPGSHGRYRYVIDYEGNVIYYRLIDNVPYTVFGTEKGGPIMYKKMPSRNTTPITPILNTKPKNYTRKNIEKALFNGQRTNTKIYNNYLSKKPYFEKGTMKRAK